MTTQTNNFIEVVSVLEQAINLKETNLTEYARTRNLELVKFVESDPKPAVFKLIRISSEMLLRLKEISKTDKTTFRYLCFLASCQEYRVGDEVVKAKLLDNTTIAEDLWIEQLREEFGFETVEELVLVAYKYQSISKRNPFYV